MPADRRSFMGLGLAGATAAFVSPVSNIPMPSPNPPKMTPPSPPQKRDFGGFPGMPQDGHLYYGAHLKWTRSLSSWEDDLGTSLAVNRTYFRAEDVTGLLSQCREDLARRRLPHVSIKPLGTWADVASGRRDQWLGRLLSGLAPLDGPVFFTVHHEPENDSGGAGMRAEDFVAMQRRIVRKARAQTSNVAVVPVQQWWTFAPMRDDVQPGRWVVPEAPIFGVDIYNPWSQTNGLEWVSFGSKLADITPWAEGRPIAVGEYGTREDPRSPGRAAQWLRDAFEHARHHDVVSLAYFNSGHGADTGTFRLSGRQHRAFESMLKSRWVARPELP